MPDPHSRFATAIVLIAEDMQEQINFPQHHQCDEVQGYLYSRSLPVDKVKKFLFKLIAWFSSL